MQAILGFLGGVVRLIALVLATVSATSAVLALGGVRSDRLDVLTHFAPIYGAAALVALALYLLARQDSGGWTTPVLVAIALIAVGVMMGPDLAAGVLQGGAKPGGQTLKLVQFNIWGRNRTPAATAHWILDQDPDVIVLEEAFDNTLEVPRLLAARYPYRTTCSEPHLCSTMLLSKVRPSAEGGLQSPGEPARLPGAWATYGQGPAAFTLIGAHFTWPLPAGPQQAQSRRLAAAVARFDRAAAIVAGDFNATPWSFSLRRQDKRLGLERRTHGVFSWPADQFSRWRINSPIPFLAIDHVYAGASWKTVSVRRGPRLGSDHYPVVVVLTR